MDRKRFCVILWCWIAIFLVNLYQDTHAVKILGIHLLSESNKTEYVLNKEKAIITCEYETGESEKIQKVHWHRDGVEFYTWVKDKRPTMPSSNSIFKNRIRKNSDPSKLIIEEAHIEMAGEIECKVVTKENSDNRTMRLVVVADTCKESDWKFRLNKTACTENVQFSCKGFYPSPTFSCGMYNRIKQSFIQSTSVRIVEQGDRTYDLSVTQLYRAKDFTDHSDVAFRCDIIIYGAAYRPTIEKEMFGERGCSPDYPGPGRGSINASVENTCWNQPADGSIVTYTCVTGEVKTITCINGTWFDESESVVSDQPFCGRGTPLYEVSVLFSVALPAAIMVFLW